MADRMRVTSVMARREVSAEADAPIITENDMGCQQVARGSAARQAMSRNGGACHIPAVWHASNLLDHNAFVGFVPRCPTQPGEQHAVTPLATLPPSSADVANS